MLKLIRPFLVCLTLSSGVSAVPLPHKSAFVSGALGSVLMLHCLRESARAHKMRPQERKQLLAAAVSAVISIAYARTKLQKQGVFSREALANAGLAILAKDTKAKRPLKTQALNGLLGVSLLLANRAIFDYLFVPKGHDVVQDVTGQMQKYGVYWLYMTQVAQRSTVGLAWLELLYQGLLSTRKSRVKFANLLGHVSSTAWTGLARLVPQTGELWGREHVKLKTVTCSICLEGASQNNPVQSYCLAREHGFHEQCIARWVEENNDCPQCRGDISKKTEPWIREELARRLADATADMNPFA